MHDRLAIALAECAIERLPVMLGQVVPDEWLSTVFVYSLQDLVCGSVSETGEEGEEAAGKGFVGGLAEDDLVELCGAGDSTLVGHETLGDGVDGVEDDELGDTRAAYSHAIVSNDQGVGLGDAIPAPNIRAAVDSLSVLAAEPAAFGVGIEGAIAADTILYQTIQTVYVGDGSGLVQRKEVRTKGAIECRKASKLFDGSFDN